MTRIFEELVHEITSHLHHPQYHDPETPQAPEAPVSLLDDIRAEFGRAVTWTEDEFRSALPTVAKAADTAEAIASSNAAKAVLDAVLSPEDEAWIVGLVQRLDQGVHQAEQNLHAGEPVPDPEPEPVDGEPVPVPAGPVVGGQAQ